MSDAPKKFSKVRIELTLHTTNGVQTIGLDGMQPPGKLAELGGYLKKLVDEHFSGMGETEADRLKDRIKVLETELAAAKAKPEPVSQKYQKPTL